MAFFTIKEWILEVARRNSMLLMTKKMEDLSNVIPLCQLVGHEQPSLVKITSDPKLHDPKKLPIVLP